MFYKTFYFNNIFLSSKKRELKNKENIKTNIKRIKTNIFISIKIILIDKYLYHLK